MIDANAPHSAAPKTEYTPTTEEVRINYIGTIPELAGDRPWMEHRPAEFNRWLAEYTRQQREEAWDEGAAEAHNNHLSYEEVQMVNPYPKETP